ncbi:H-NS histone family protein [Massilia aquatica]|uniref:H-NS histone family protein n=1 Tax=Massilia aquatica TaxID=2609000 RepID=A0ABX0M0L4_9BURK|nr:H-NS histone family protein [Massilia aquatica]NHZ38568.1 H-NS histone family protein [Massilia aquatica]
MNNLSKLSLRDLRTLETQVQEALKTRHFLAISKAREQILHIAQSAGLSVEDILNTKVPNRVKAASVAVKYRNPENSTEAWTGRGRQPLWVRAWLEAGKSLNALTV